MISFIIENFIQMTIDVLAVIIAAVTLRYILKKNKPEIYETILGRIISFLLCILVGFLVHIAQNKVIDIYDIEKNEYYILAVNKKNEKSYDHSIDAIDKIPNNFQNDKLYIELKNEVARLFKIEIIEQVVIYENEKKYQKAYDYLNDKYEKLKIIKDNDAELETKSGELYGYIGEEKIISFIKNEEYDLAREFCKEEKSQKNCKSCVNIEKIIEKNMINNQKVKVLKADLVEKIESGYGSWKVKYCEPTLYNNFDKPLKTVELVILHYDKNNFPHDKEEEGGAGHEIVVSIDDVNILPQSEKYIKIDDIELISGKRLALHSTDLDEMSKYSSGCKAIACVKYAEFYDDTTWNNPYYDIWYKKYYDRCYE